VDVWKIAGGERERPTWNQPKEEALGGASHQLQWDSLMMLDTK